MKTSIKYPVAVVVMTLALAFTSVGQTLPAGTVAYYPFNGTTLDASGNGNDLHATAGSAQYAAGLFGGAAYFDGATLLTTPSGAVPGNWPTGANPFTVACFVKADLACSANNDYFSYGTLADNSGNSFALVNGFTGVHNWWVANDVDASLPSGSFQDGYHSVVATWDGTNRNIYLDGVLRYSQVPGTLPSIGSNQVAVGCAFAGIPFFFTGWLDELLIANRAFTAAEVLSYQQGGGTLPTPTGLVATPNSAQVFLSWTPVGGATGYNVKRSQTDGGPYAVIGTAATATYTDTSVINGTTYYYVVSATNTLVESANSAQVSATPNAPVLPTGVVAYYPFNGTALDASGSGNDLSPEVGSAQYVAGLFGGAAYFDGSTRLSTYDGAVPGNWPMGANPFTVACFVKADTNNAASDSDYFNYGNLSDNRGNCFALINDSTVVKNWWVANDAYASLPSGSFKDGFHSVVATWDGTNRDIYLDGVLQYSQIPATLPNIGGNFVTVGCAFAGIPLFFTGWLDELLVADRAFSAAEVLAYHQYGVPGVPPSTLPSPTGLTANPQSSQVTLNWAAVGGATGYKVKRSQTNGGPYSVIGTAATATYTDTSVINGTQYYYVVSATNSVTESPNSAQVSAKPTGAPPTPTGLWASFGNAQVLLGWTSAGGATGYKVKRSQTNGGPYSVIGTAATATYTDTSVINGTQYYYVVSATNSVGESANSAQVSAKPRADLLPGTVAYYPFNGDILDASGNGNDLHATAGSAQYDTNGVFGGAAYFDGFTILATASGAVPAIWPNGANPFTVACFVKADSSNRPDDADYFCYGTLADNSGNCFALMTDSTVVKNWWVANDIYVSLPSGSFKDGYHSVVATWDGTNRNVYLDGVQRFSGIPAALPSMGSGQVTVGAAFYGIPFFFTGWLDELLVADRAFSAAELAAYQQYGGTGVPTTPVPGPLQIKQSGNSVKISWPATGSYTLQQNTNLATATWETSGYPITTANGTSSISITSPTGNLYFRLTNP